MAHGRVPLTDKEEKILVQAQLMGLSTASMVKIGNRLRAIEKERRDKAEIENAIHGYSWEEVFSPDNAEKRTGWIIKTPSGHECHFDNRRRGKNTWYNRSFEYDVTISKPGTRFKTRALKKVEICTHDDWRARLCPASNKEVYAMIHWARQLDYHLERSK